MAREVFNCESPLALVLRVAKTPSVVLFAELIRPRLCVHARGETYPHLVYGGLDLRHLLAKLVREGVQIGSGCRKLLEAALEVGVV